MVKLLLNARADPNGGKLDAPLLCSIHQRDAASAELLLENGANPNVTGTYDLRTVSAPTASVYSGRNQVGMGSRGDAFGGNQKFTPLWLAISGKQLPMVKLLLKFQADPNGPQADGQPLLFSALSDLGLLEALLHAGANPNVKDHQGRTPLSVAAESGSTDAVKMLLDAKADPYFYIESYRPKVVRTFLDGKYNLNDSRVSGQPLLFSALADTNLLVDLLAAGAKVDPVSTDETERTPLGAAAFQNNAAAVAILLKHGANPNVRNRNGVTPLHLAAYGLADKEVFELLLANKANPDVRTGNGQTPLDELKGKLTATGVTPEQKTLAGELADLLRRHGALDALPDWDRIIVSRPAANFSFALFRKGTNEWNQFTLLEALLNFYNSSETYSIPQGNNTWAGYSLKDMLPFPDLTRVVILRPSRGSTNTTRLAVNLLDRTNGIDVSKDVPLEFGDIVELPERDHALGDVRVNLTDNESAALFDYLKGKVQLAVRNQKVELAFDRIGSQATIRSVLNQPEAQKIILSSSDLSRVKVTRRNPKTGKISEWTFDCSNHPTAFNGSLSYSFSPNQPNDSLPSLDFWLRSGDLIEVPEKP
jgi:cytohesin